MGKRPTLKVKDRFKERYEKLTDFDRFMECCNAYLTKSVRINTIKIKEKDCIKRLGKEWELKQVPWCRQGYWLKGRTDIGNSLEHFLGYIYVQEAASMIPPIVLNVKKGLKVLDMCAAPGSKTSQIAALMDNTGVLVANDYKGLRMKALGINVQRCGITNTIMTLMTGFGIKNIEFDRVLVDAPCSGTGTIMKSQKTVDIWNPLMIKRLGSTQKKLLSKGFELLKQDGTLVYSTCSVEPEENEEVVDHFLEHHENAKLEKISLDIKKSKTITEFEGKVYNEEVKKCLRIWPQDNNTEGFFIAKIKKYK